MATSTIFANVKISDPEQAKAWSCLDWNRPSIDFYLSLGADPMDEWTTYRLTGETLVEMARS
ncbi:MAG: hypothetical protein IKE24_05265 [Clostridia bacterium]|nr:hypothetical protein [Clostridia bacterium]